MRKWIYAALLCLVLLVPMVSRGQSINYYPPAGGTTTIYTKALNEGSNTEVIRVTVPVGGAVSFKVLWTAYASDETDFQAVVNSNSVGAVNKAGTISAATGSDGADLNPLSAGSFSCTESVGVGATYVLFQLNCTSSLAQTTLQGYVVILPNYPASPTVVVP